MYGTTWKREVSSRAYLLPFSPNEPQLLDERNFWGGGKMNVGQARSLVGEYSVTFNIMSWDPSTGALN